MDQVKGVVEGTGTQPIVNVRGRTALVTAERGRGVMAGGEERWVGFGGRYEWECLSGGSRFRRGIERGVGSRVRRASAASGWLASKRPGKKGPDVQGRPCPCRLLLLDAIHPIS